MTTAKEDVAEMLQRLPENAQLEDIQYHLYVLEKIRRGISRAETEGVVSHDDARQQLAAWLDS